MTWQILARKDFAEAKNPRVIKAVLALFVLACLVVAYQVPIGEFDAGVTTDDFATSVPGLVSTFLALVGVLLGYKSVVTEREDGSLRLVLALPHTRRDVLVGKFLGRGALLATVVTAALVAGGVLVVYPYGSLLLFPYLAFVGLTLLLGLIFLALALAISASVSTELRATAGSFGVFVVFALLWSSLFNALETALTELDIADGELPNGLLFVESISPTTLYDRIVTAFFGSGVDPVFGRDAPVYANEWLAVVLFVGWLVVPLALGYWRFEVTEL